MQSVSIRSLFIPDDGYFIADVDLVKADLHVVVWEADDKELKQQLAEGVDVYSEAGSVVGLDNYALCKRAIHLSNYGGLPKTLAQACSITIHEADIAQRRWFSAHPGIIRWHERTEQLLKANPPRITNKFGYHRIYFSRRGRSMLREALAWVPQSTVACVTNRALVAVDEQLPWCELGLQVHDSLVLQFPKTMYAQRWQIGECMKVTVPYDDPLVIPSEIKVSDSSWGECTQVSWHD